MPSPRHDFLVRLFKESPELAVEILRDLKGVPLPDGARVNLEANDFNDRPSKDFQPDVVVTLGAPQTPLQGIIVEVQQEPSESKRKQLARYAAALWLMLRRRVTVLVVCPDARTAAYYAAPLVTDLPGYTFEPVVLGPDEVPVLTDPAQVRVRPRLAVMSVAAHGADRKVVEVFVEGLDDPALDHAADYYEYAYNLAASVVQRNLEDVMKSTEWPVYSPFAREHFGRGEAHGRAQGEAQGEAKALLVVLSARGLEASSQERERISSCTDLEQLEAWLARAASVESVAELFD
ncbi:hypothetical protein ACQEU3_23285 [Spirillospora sp. CA-253888]